MKLDDNPPTPPTKGEHNIQETFCDLIQSTLASTSQKALDSDMIQTSAKRTDWINGGELLKETTLVSECKHQCIMSVKEYKILSITDAVSAVLP